MNVIALQINFVDSSIASQSFTSRDAAVVAQELVAEIPRGLRRGRDGGNRPRTLHASNCCLAAEPLWIFTGASEVQFSQTGRCPSMPLPRQEEEEQQRQPAAHAMPLNATACTHHVDGLHSKNEI